MGEGSPQKLRVAVIMGGRTAEHDISLGTGTVIANHLPRERFDVVPVMIARDGLWHVAAAPLGPEQEWSATGGELTPPVRLGKALDGLCASGVDAVFLAMHGPFGEDGTIQGLFEMLDIPYTGSDVYASSLCMDKPRTKEVLSHHGFPTPPWVTLSETQWREDPGACAARVAGLGFPVISKPPRLGSSVGTSLARGADEVARAVEETLAYDDRALVEKVVSGEEITCAVLGARPGEAPTPLPLVQVVPRSADFFDYKAKYTPGATEEICPAPIDEATTAEAQAMAVRIHELLGCGGLSRTDMIRTGQGLTVLEVNTIPGMTSASLYPQAARAIGLDFPSLLSTLVELAIEQHRGRRVCLRHDELERGA